MSIPLVRNNTRDAINTSIIAIKKNLERINSILGLMDSSEPDLSGLATKQELEDAVTEINNTIDEVETSLQPVDTVQSGNMSAVTSNAVATSNAMPVNSVTSGNMHSVTSNAVFNINYQAIKYGANYDCNTMGEGVALINGEVLNSPYKQGLTTQGIGYLFTRKIATNSGYQSQIVISYRDNELFTRTYTDNGWTSWRRITSLKEKKIRIDDSGYTLRNGVYVKEITNFFTNNGIDYSKVVNIRQVNNGNNFYPYFFISYDASDLLGVFKFANVSNIYIDIKIYYE